MSAIWDVNRSDDKKHGSWSFHMDTSKIFQVTFDFGVDGRPMHLLVQGRIPHLARWRTVVEGFSEDADPQTHKLKKKFAPAGYDDEFIAWLEYKNDANDIWRESQSLNNGTLDWNQIWFFFGFGGSSNPVLRIDWVPSLASVAV